MRSYRNTLVTIILLASFVVLGIAAVRAPSASFTKASATKAKHKNLKVLPQDISDEKLDSIMQTYNVALGVNCKFCHVPVKNIPDSLDYASDAEPMKEAARKMMQMTIYINKTHFYFNKEERPEYLKVVTCNTCHRGEAFPEQ